MQNWLVAAAYDVIVPWTKAGMFTGGDICDKFQTV
jgi:hypothetical protein